MKGHHTLDYFQQGALQDHPGEDEGCAGQQTLG